MTLSAVGSAVFSSNDADSPHLNKASSTPASASSTHQTPTKRNSKTDPLRTPAQQQLSPVLSPASPISPSPSGHSHLSDLSFTPPHPYTQLNLLSSSASAPRPPLPSHSQPLPSPEDLSLRCHGVSVHLHHLASSLEHWTNLLSPPVSASASGLPESSAEGEESPMAIKRVKDHLIPDMVSRLRYLSGVLDGSIDSNDYEDIFGGDSLGLGNSYDSGREQGRQGQHLQQQEEDENDDSIISASSSVLTPSRPNTSAASAVLNSSRLISKAYDSDDSSVMPPSPAPAPATATSTTSVPLSSSASGTPTAISTSSSAAPPSATASVSLRRSQEELTLSDWVGSGRGDPSSAISVEDLLLQSGGDNISPIQILYSKPSSAKQPNHNQLSRPTTSTSLPSAVSAVSVISPVAGSSSTDSH
jgi:hypothetical protein